MLGRDSSGSSQNWISNSIQETDTDTLYFSLQVHYEF